MIRGQGRSFCARAEFLRSEGHFTLQRFQSRFAGKGTARTSIPSSQIPARAWLVEKGFP